ncbi:MAG: hypothetical protein M0028_09030, partial [Clostridia bacterium]|nr:hypothetical protein [Clostridia bacterium]
TLGFDVSKKVLLCRSNPTYEYRSEVSVRGSEGGSDGGPTPRPLRTARVTTRGLYVREAGTGT